YYNTLALPMGFEKQMYDAFRVAYRCGAVAADYDALMGLWHYTGLSDYTLAKTFTDPAAPLDQWEAEYYSAFGAAADAMKRYYRYWRDEFWQARIQPHLGEIVERGRHHNFARGLIWSLGDY